MPEETKLGKIEISPRAIASIAIQSLKECYGVVGLATSRTLWQDIDRIMHRKGHQRGIDVRLVGDEIIIDLYVVIEYGTRISEVAQNIMNNVKFNVEKALGLPIAQVNVHVQKLRVG